MRHMQRPSSGMYSAGMGINDDDHDFDFDNESDNHSTSHYRKNPIFKIYKSRKDFDHKDTKKQGAAIQLDYSVSRQGVPGMFLKMARQSTPVAADGVCNFDWKKSRIFFKLKTWDITKFLTVLNYTEPYVEFSNISDEGKRIIQLTSLEHHKDPYVRGQVALFEKGDDTYYPRETGLNPKSVGIRIIEEGESPMRLTLDVDEVMGMRVFLDEGLRRIFYATYE